MMNKKYTPKLYVVSAPSGGGKTTIGENLLKSDKNIARSVSMTTRKPRKGERNRRDYFFVTKEEFLKVKNKKGFLESAKVFDCYYGTPIKFIKDTLRKGKDILLLIDVQGARQIRRKMKNIVQIFIMPPSLEELENRLRRRSTDSNKEIKKRLLVAKKEIKDAKYFDYIVFNNHLARAKKEVKAILTAERLKA